MWHPFASLKSWYFIFTSPSAAPWLRLPAQSGPASTATTSTDVSRAPRGHNDLPHRAPGLGRSGTAQQLKPRYFCAGLIVFTLSHRSPAVWFGLAWPGSSQRSCSSRQGTHWLLHRLSSQKLPTSCRAWHCRGCTGGFCKTRWRRTVRLSETLFLNLQQYNIMNLYHFSSSSKEVHTYSDQNAVQIPGFVAVAVLGVLL